VSEPKVLFENIEGVGMIRLNATETANAMDLELGEALLAMLKAAESDPEIKVVVLTGNGSTFSAGANFKAIKRELAENPDQTPDMILYRFVGAFNKAAMVMIGMKKPTMAAVNGTAAGGGLALALACDLVVASDQARFDPVYVRLGLTPMGGMTGLLPVLLGPKKAAEFLFMAKPISAMKADQMGLINVVVSHEDLMDRVLETARRIMAHPGEGVGRTKRLLWGDPEALEKRMDDEAEALRCCVQAQETRAIWDALLKGQS
jgi:2-(1,2-epoxy-1,2-dihydrophenyl)acetyl-CoA isomerase